MNRTGEGVRLSLVSVYRVLHILVHHILSPPECSIVGGDNQNYMSYQPSKRTGYIYYPYPIPCTGIITTFTASGFCIVTGRTDQNVSLRLIVTSTQSDREFHQVKNMAAECGNSTINSSSGIEYSFGTVFRESLNIPVSSGDYLGFEFTCSEKHCFFQTAIVNDTGKNLYIPKDVETLSNVSLLFSATISETSGMFL